MLEISYIRQNPDDVIKRLKVKNFDASDLVKEILDLDNVKRSTQVKVESILAETNKISKEIGNQLRTGSIKETEILKSKILKFKEETAALEKERKRIEEELDSKMVLLPNLPNASVPIGKTSSDNEVIKQDGKMPVFEGASLPHWEIAKKYDLIDFESGVKITGAGFPLYKGKGAKLQRALINFFLDKAIESGYTEIEPPILVNEQTGYGTGQIPDKEGQMYFVPLDRFYLIPTAEVPITNIYRDMVVSADVLPFKHCGYTPCFRREAGSYGKEVRGLNRLHQFDKVEIVQICNPDDSYRTLEEMMEYVVGLLKMLELPYRVVKLCGGDMSFASALTYDMEVYSGGQRLWLEVSSVSNFETFQSNRMKLRIKKSGEKTKFAHTLNGSALALPRIVAALLENNYNDSGVRIPQCLIPYTGFENIN